MSAPRAAVVPVQAGAAETTGVAALCIAALLLWSRDGQAWLARTLDDAWRNRGRVTALVGAAVVGVVVSFMLRAR